MSQINFITQHRLFMEYSKRNKLTSHERLFYIALFYIANDLAMETENHDWPDDYFPVSNSELNGWSGLDERAIRNLRNSLKQKGLIDFKKGDGKKKDPEYRIFYLRKDTKTGYRIAPDRGKTDSKNAADKPTGYKNAPDNTPTDCEFAPDTVGDSVGDHVGDDVVTDCEFAPDNALSTYDYIKINKEKERNKNKEGDIVSYRILKEGKEMDDPMRSDAEPPDKISAYTQIIKQNIAYDDLLLVHPDDRKTIDGIVDLMLETVLSDEKDMLIASAKYPASLVKGKFLKLDYSDIEYVLFAASRNTSKVGNIKKYMLATLFNAKSTNSAYFAAEVNHDMYG